VTEKVSTLLFAPTKLARHNLLKEGYDKNVFLTGDVMKDSLVRFYRIARRKSEILHKLKLRKKHYMVATIHRPENTDNMDRLLGIFEALSRVERTIIFPAHPRTIKRLAHKIGSVRALNNIVLTAPMGYLDFIKLLGSSEKVITDSGGIQKEAYLLSIPCVTVYEATDWQETVDDGWNVLANPESPEDILEAIESKPTRRRKNNHYGDGHAARRIVTVINRYLKFEA
jgi:UDP-N-acetylglucosamine 2-epimerase